SARAHPRPPTCGGRRWRRCLWSRPRAPAATPARADRREERPSHAHPEAQADEIEVQDASLAVEGDRADLLRVSPVPPAEAPASGVRQLRVLRRSRGPRGRVAATGGEAARAPGGSAGPQGDAAGAGAQRAVPRPEPA